MMINTSACTYSRRISSFFQEYADMREKKEGFLLIELLLVLAGTMIIVAAYLYWCLLIQTMSIQTDAAITALSQAQIALGHGQLRAGDNLSIESLPGPYHVAYKGTVLTADSYKPYRITAAYGTGTQQRIMTFIGATCCYQEV